MGRLRDWLAPPVPPGFDAARPTSSAFFWIYGIVGLILTAALLALGRYVGDPLFFLLPVLAAGLSAVYLVNATQRRLEFGTAGFRLRVGPYQRFIASAELAAIEPGRARHAESVVLLDGSGTRLRLVLGSAYRQQPEWAALVLATAKANRIALDPAVATLLRP